MGSHLNHNGEFQSDKYPGCPAGKIPLSTADPMAQDLLWEYARRRRVVDAEFSADAETALKRKGFDPADAERLAQTLPDDMFAKGDAVNHPKHYNSHPSGIEAVEVCEYLSFNLGNAIKYLWRVGLKGDGIEDLRKAEWYLTREGERLRKRRECSIEMNRFGDWSYAAKDVAAQDTGVLGDVLRILLEYNRGYSHVESVPVDMLLRVQKEIEARR